MPTKKHSPRKLLFLEPVKGRSKEELAQAIIRQLERYGVKIKKKRGSMAKTKKTPKRVKLRQATLEEWRKLGLPETSSVIHFGKPPWAKKLQELKKK